MPTVQMNTRLDERIKESGDAALAQAGFSPSQTVRAIWEFAAAHNHDPQAIKSLLREFKITVDPEREERIAQKKAALIEVTNLRESLSAQLGFNPWQNPDDTPYEQLREEALLSRWEERGLL